MKVLITGGAGFIGSNYVFYHKKNRPDDVVYVLDALTYSGNKDNIKEAGHINFIHGRIEDRKLVFDLFEKEKFDHVVHFAAESHVDRSIKDPEIFTRTNVLGTQVLLDAAKEFGIRRFHHISTDEVYGDLGIGSHAKFKEDTPLQPSSPYSASKAASDLLCLAYSRTYGLDVTISRCSNNYGPFQSLENFIPKFITLALGNKKLPLYGSGENVRDWLFVADHCHAVLNILENGKAGEIYNIGGNCEKKNIDVVQLILKILGKDESLIEFVDDRKGHDERYAIDYNKIGSALGWKPTCDFENALTKTIEWYKLNAYERSYTRWWNGYQAQSAHKSDKQTSSAGL